MATKLFARRGTKVPPPLTDRQWRILNFLELNPIGVISSVTPDGNPHGAVIYFSVDNQFNVFFLTKSGTRKHDNLRHNNHVMLTVFEPITQTTAQITGVATELTDPAAIAAVAGEVFEVSLKTSSAGPPPISKLQAGSYVAYMVEPAQIRMATYANPDRGNYTDLFESIESFELKPA